VQRPRIPIVVGGSFERRGPRARALRWDGCCLYGVTADGKSSRDLTPDDVRGLRSAARQRPGDGDFVIMVGGRARRPDLAAEIGYATVLAEAGADWRLEYIEPTGSLEQAREVIRGGPVRAEPG
jgi:hypothetical protein